MERVATNFTVSDYCAGMERNEIMVNRDYQRSEQVWPEVARSFLIETVLLGFPMPKMYLYSVVDLKKRKTVKEIVDGQQRSMAIKDYFDDKFSLSGKLETEELAGKKFSELDPDWQQKFITYSISADLFVSATEEEVRETFRRMNSYTIPLNPEEQRHAEFQGTFKWFVHHLARGNQGIFVRAGIFGAKPLVRMQDLKLICEIIHALLFGIKTTNKKDLRYLYMKYDDGFPSAKRVQKYFDFAFSTIAELQAVHESRMMRPYIVYSLVLAIIHSKFGVSKFNNIAPGKLGRSLKMNRFQEHLLDLSESLNTDDDDVERSKYKEFILASRERTNVKEQREARMKWICQAYKQSI